MPADIIDTVVGLDLLTVVGYGIGNVLQLVTVFPGQLLHSLLHCDRIFIRRFGGKENAVGRTGDERHKANYNDNCCGRAHASHDCRRQRAQRRQEMPNHRAHNLNHLASLLGSVLGGLLCALGKLLSFLLGSSFRLHGVGGGADLLLVTVHAADSMRGSFNGVCLFFGRQSLLLCGTVIRGDCRLIYTCFFPASRCRGGIARLSIPLRLPF